MFHRLKDFCLCLGVIGGPAEDWLRISGVGVTFSVQRVSSSDTSLSWGAWDLDTLFERLVAVGGGDVEILLLRTPAVLSVALLDFLGGIV